MSNTTLPKTVQEAVERLLPEILAKSDADAIDRFRGMQDDELYSLHFMMGMGIRNELGLWGRNPELLKDCGVTHPDDASHVIIKAMHDHLVSIATPVEMERAAAARERWLAGKLEARRRLAMEDAERTDRRCTRCGLPCPRYRKTCVACGYEMGREWC